MWFGISNPSIENPNAATVLDDVQSWSKLYIWYTPGTRSNKSPGSVD